MSLVRLSSTCAHRLTVSQKEELAKKPRLLLKGKREPKPPTTTPSAERPDEREETFWNTPGAAARTLHSTGDSLLDEEVDLANVSTASFGTPVVHHRKVPSLQVEEQVVEREDEDLADEEEDEVDEVLDKSDDTAEPTVILAKHGMPRDEGRSPPEPSPEPEEVDAGTPFSQDVEPADAVTPHHRHKVKVTTELERIVVSSGLLFVDLHGHDNVTIGEGMVYRRGDHYAWSSVRHPGQEYEQEQASTCKGNHVCFVRRF